jgi:two-component system cell cycle sensor histidine kinase/response regulator CckA
LLHCWEFAGIPSADHPRTTSILLCLTIFLDQVALVKTTIHSIGVGVRDMQPTDNLQSTGPESFRTEISRVERRQWWLSFSGVVVTLILTVGIISVSVSIFVLQRNAFELLNFQNALRALVALVLLFVVYAIYQQLQIHRFRMHAVAREELFRLIGENAADMIAVVTVDGQRLYNSPSYEKVLGYSSEELTRTSAYEQIHPDDRPLVLAAASEARGNAVGRRLEYRIRHKNGEWLVVESTASAVRNAEGKVEKLVIVNRDITERKQLEQQLVLSQKLDAIGRLSGGVAHDFNNILGVIIGYSEALQEKFGPDDPYREAVDEIQKAGKRAASLTQQLLAFSRKQVLEPKVLDLNAVVADVEKMLRRLIGEDIELKLTTSPELGMVKTDRGQIEQVILNLAVNARDAMPRGGELKIETANAELTEKDAKRYRYVVPGQYVNLQIGDTGCGMDEELQSHIFEPFFTTKEKGKGTGLGLATVYGVIKQSGGYIWVESQPGKGSRFSIYLRRVEGSAEKVLETEGPVKRIRGPQTVLLVEDEASLRKLTRNTLEQVGFTVLEAQDAFEAVNIAAQTNAVIDLLLTDVVMPGRSGPELAGDLAAARPRMRVLFMSGYTDGAIEAHGVLESGILILRKPFTRHQLTLSIEEVLGRKEQESTAAKSIH